VRSTLTFALLLAVVALGCSKAEKRQLLSIVDPAKGAISVVAVSSRITGSADIQVIVTKSGTVSYQKIIYHLGCMADIDHEITNIDYDSGLHAVRIKTIKSHNGGPGTETHFIP